MKFASLFIFVASVTFANAYYRYIGENDCAGGVYDVRYVRGNLATCERICNSLSDCQGIMDVPSRNYCYLKRGNCFGHRTFNRICRLYRKEGTPVRHVSYGYQYIGENDCAGGVYDVRYVRGNLATCERICNSLSDCQGIMDVPSRNYCYLKRGNCFGHRTFNRICRLYRKTARVYVRRNNYLGCYQDSSRRALPKYFNLGSRATPALCVATCRSKGYRFAGVQYYYQCFCGDKLGYRKLPSSRCNTRCKGNRSVECGGAWANSVYSTGIPQRRTPSNYDGCYQDHSRRALPKYINLGARATPELCVARCRSLGYRFAGSQYYYQCFCGDRMGYNKLPSSRCNTPCKGNVHVMCGGAWANSVYSTGIPQRRLPSNYDGCYQDHSKRALPKYINLGARATPELCVARCRSLGYRFAGSQYYYQCFCGDRMGYNKLPSSRCNTPCKGNVHVMCGGAWANSVYSTGIPQRRLPLNYDGCYQDHSKRALPKYINLGARATPELCVARCRSLGYRFAGSQYYYQCFCGDRMGYNKLPSSRCNTPCKGNVHVMCGGAWANSVYSTGIPQRRLPSNYDGCYQDHSRRALPKYINLGARATPELCVARCRSLGYRFAGSQYYYQCFCGDRMGYNKLPSSRCNTPCKGNVHVMCGGAWANSVYSTGIPKRRTPSNYRGCYQDRSRRALPKYFNLGARATPDLCVRTCKARGYKYAGVQYYYQCFCGNRLGYNHLPSSRCNAPCKGDVHVMCGGAWANSIYATGHTKPTPRPTTTPKPTTTPRPTTTPKPKPPHTHGGNAGGAPCFFPFIYRGKTYYECTKASSSGSNSWNDLWCATVHNYDTQGGKWGYCNTNKA